MGTVNVFFVTISIQYIYGIHWHYCKKGHNKNNWGNGDITMTPDTTMKTIV